MKRVRNLALFFAIALIFALSGLSVALGLQSVNDLMHPARTPCCDKPTHLLFELQDVSFTTSDGLKLYGWYTPPKNRAVILMLHGRGGNRSGNLSMAPMFIRHGYGILTIDMRAYGQSDGTSFAYCWRDVAAAVDWLRNQPDVDAIGGIGFSLGANVMVMGAAHVAGVEALVADGVGPEHWAGHAAARDATRLAGAPRRPGRPSRASELRARNAVFARRAGTDQPASRTADQRRCAVERV